RNRLWCAKHGASITAVVDRGRCSHAFHTLAGPVSSRDRGSLLSQLRALVASIGCKITSHEHSLEAFHLAKLRMRVLRHDAVDRRVAHALRKYGRELSSLHIDAVIAEVTVGCSNLNPVRLRTPGLT